MDVENDPRAAARVFYDGDCPVCRREIRWYRNRNGSERIEWVDVASADEIDGPPGLTRGALMRRFTVERRDGETARGAAGFVAVWRALPQTATIARMLDNWVAVWIGERLYRLMLLVRPLWRMASDKAA
ncbi:MAG: DUF393 domain-containing protein [Pseudomonadota bacterium]